MKHLIILLAIICIGMGCGEKEDPTLGGDTLNTNGTARVEIVDGSDGLVFTNSALLLASDSGAHTHHPCPKDYSGWILLWMSTTTWILLFVMVKKGLLK